MTITVPDRGAAIEAEQKFFDDVVEERENKRGVRLSSASSTGDKKAAAALRRNGDGGTLGASDDAAAFARYDTKDGGCYYVGYGAVPSAGVYSWKARYILKLRTATHKQPGEVERRRRFETSKFNRIDAIDDTVFAELAERVAALEDGESFPPLIDAQLQDALNSDRSTEMRQIVETLQAAQSALIGADARQVLVVQGGPGTGKTAVALHRLSSILFNEPGLNAEDVLVVGPSATFTKYIGRVLPELGDESIRVVDLGHLIEGDYTVGLHDGTAAARLKGDLRMVDVLGRALANRVRVPGSELEFSVADVAWTITVAPEEIERLLTPLRELSYEAGRRTLRRILSDHVADKIRARFESERRLSGQEDLARRVSSRDLDAAVERCWPRMTAHGLLADLFGSLDRLVDAAGDDLSGTEVQMLRRASATKTSAQVWSAGDLFLLDEARALLGERPKQYGHIVVDEAQDLSPMQVRAIARRSRTGAMTIAGDIAQSTGLWARNSWEDLLDLIETDLPKTIASLEYGYRVPREVMEYAAQLLPWAAEGVQPPRSVRSVGAEPGVTELADGPSTYDPLLEVLLDFADDMFVGVVVPDTLRADIAAVFDDAGLPYTDADGGELGPSFNLVSPVGAKGLEFDTVVVVDPLSIAMSDPHGYRLLYIALTRTTRYLEILHPLGRLPEALGGDVPMDEPHATVDLKAGQAEGVAVLRELQDVTAHNLHGGVASTPEAAGGVDASPDGSATARKVARSLTPRQEAVVARTADEIVELLSETVPPVLWQEILERAGRSLSLDSDN
ncbi:HelD family protein [Promicromonospora sp. Marseille-Q5078]